MIWVAASALIQNLLQLNAMYTEIKSFVQGKFIKKCGTCKGKHGALSKELGTQMFGPNSQDVTIGCQKDAKVV